MNRIKWDPSVERVEELCKDRYAVRYKDGSALLVDSQGKTVPSPLDRYEIVMTVRRIGELQGMPHFAFKACDWATRNRPETGMFDYAGHERLFQDPRLSGLETLEEVQAEFNKLVIASHDLSNPRRNDVMTVDLRERPNLSMKL